MIKSINWSTYAFFQFFTFNSSILICWKNIHWTKSHQNAFIHCAVMKLCWEDLKKVACLQHCPQRPRSCFHLQDIFSHLLKVLMIQTQPLSTLLNLYLIRSDPWKKKLRWLLNNKKKLFVGKKDYLKNWERHFSLLSAVLFTGVASILALKKLSQQKISIIE